MTLWGILLSIVVVIGAGLLFLSVYLWFTRTTRRELEAAADMEIEEMRIQGAWNGRPAFLRRSDLGEEAKKKVRLTTEAGKELSRIEEKSRFIMIVGMIVGLIALVIYLKMN